MKTKLAHILSGTALVALLSTTAFAGKPIQFRSQERSKPVAETADCCSGARHCGSGADCCATRSVATPALSGKGSHRGFKSVRVCTAGCPVDAGRQAVVCREGKRA